MSKKNKHLKRLLLRNKSLEKSFYNLIEVANQDVKKKDSSSAEELELQDYNIKSYAEGLDKIHSTLEKLTNQLKVVEDEVDSILNPVEPTETTSVKPSNGVKASSVKSEEPPRNLQHSMNKHID